MCSCAPASLHPPGRSRGAGLCQDRVPHTKGAAGLGLSGKKGKFHPRGTSHAGSDADTSCPFCQQGKAPWLWAEARLRKAVWRPDKYCCGLTDVLTSHVLAKAEKVSSAECVCRIESCWACELLTGHYNSLLGKFCYHCKEFSKS